MIGKLEHDKIEEVLQQEVVGRIGCHADGETYVVPVSYAYDGKYVYVRSGPGKKLDMMRKNPFVCFQVDTMRNMADWKSVIAFGYFEEITSAVERDAAVKILLKRILPMVSSETTHLSADWPFQPKDTTEVKGIFFRIRLSEKSGRFEKNYENSGHII